MGKINVTNQQDAPLVKIAFHATGLDRMKCDETAWAFDLGNGQYKVNNVLFFVNSVSCDDIVHAAHEPGNVGKFPIFQHVVEKSGHRTIRLLMDSPTENGNGSDEILQGLVAFDCSFEDGFGGRIFAIDIPPGVELDDVVDYLNDHNVHWEPADPSCEEIQQEMENGEAE
ncbi:MAG: DUF4265 domain-containing protein [Burkholderiaceae bacterium]